MTAATLERPARRPQGGGVPARRAVIRWAVRLLRREWRQQSLILALIAAAVAATFMASAVAVNTQATSTAEFGTAQDAATLSGTPAHIAAQVASLKGKYHRVDVIEDQSASLPGSVATFDLRAQDPRGPFGQPLLSLDSGHYPAGPGQVAVTSGVASAFHLSVGGQRTFGGVTRVVTGIATDPQDLLLQFALVAPGQVTRPDQVTVLFDAPGVDPATIGPNVTSASQAVGNVINPQTISLVAAVLGMALIAMVGVGGFTVLAQRRLRAIGMLVAQGATQRHVRLVVRANGVATGVVGAILGLVVGLAGWLVYRPTAQASAHHVIGAFQLPWTVIGVSVALAVLASYFAASRPAKAISRLPVMAALAGRPPGPVKAGRLVPPAGVALLVVAFLLLGAAGATSGNGSGSGSQLLELAIGIITLCVAVVLLAGAALGLVAWLGRRAPVAVRLALRDLARYRSRSGPAVAAITIATLIAVIVCVESAGRYGNVLDYAGPNLASNQLVIYTPAGPYGQSAPITPSTVGHAGHGTVVGQGRGGGPRRTPPAQSPGQSSGQSSGPSNAQVAAVAASIARSVGAGTPITLYNAGVGLTHAAAGRSWSGPIFVATPQLLAAFGISPARVDPGADILTMRPGLSTMSLMQLTYGAGGQQEGGPDGQYPCPAGACVASPPIQEVGQLPSGTSAPNTVITEHAVQALHLQSGESLSGWLIQAPQGLTQAQVTSAQQAASAIGAHLETRNSVPSLSTIVNDATIFGIALALGILGMSVGLVRSESGRDLRTLAATGASGVTRRTLVATTALALGLTGALMGVAGGYLAAIGFARSNQLDGLSSLTSVPVGNLLLILVGMPAFAALVSWLLAGREPAAIARQPLE